jgi:uncharacterized protein YbjT (DUF2867 family)
MIASMSSIDVLLFGATGMVGQGVLRECLLDPDVRRVVTVGRAATGESHPKLTEIVTRDLFDLTAYAEALTGFDACYFCLGTSAARMTEEAYANITYDLTLSVATLLAARNPRMTFIYVSGQGTDSSEHGRMMWARVKGRTENALLRLPFRAAYMFRPGFIQPMHGIRSKTKLYNIAYVFLRPFFPLLRRLPRLATTTEQLGKAMLVATKVGAPKAVLESVDINQLGRIKPARR